MLSLAVSSDGKFIAAGDCGVKQSGVWSQGKLTLTVLGTRKYEPLWTEALEGDGNYAMTLAISPDSYHLAVGYHSAQLMLRELVTGAVVWKHCLEDKVEMAVFSPNGCFLSVCDRGMYAPLMNVTGGEPALERRAPAHYTAEGMAVSPDGMQLVCFSRRDKLLKLVSCHAADFSPWEAELDGWASVVTFAPCGGLVACSDTSNSIFSFVQ